MAIPSYKGSGTFTTGLGAITPPMPTGGAAPAAGDILLLVCESENEAISLSTPNGFVEVPTWSPQSAGTAATDPASRLAIFWKRAVGGDAAPTMADSGNHNTAQIHCFTGVKASGNPWNTGAGGNDNGLNDTSGVVPGATTTVDNCLVVLICSTSYNGTSTTEFSGWTNADLANITERTNNCNTVGLGGGHGMATGEKATAGAYGNTAVTLAHTSYKGAISIALEGAAQALTRTNIEDVSASFADSASRLLVALRGVAENVAALFADAISAAKGLLRSLADDISASFADTALRLAQYARSVTDDISAIFADLASRVAAYMRATAEDFSASFTDGITRLSALLRSAAESFAASFIDAVGYVKSGITNFTRTLAEDFSTFMDHIVDRLANYRRR